jgi:exonuclease SbcC
VADVDLQVVSLLGLTAEQFKQVLLLPQGDFRRFLLATSAEKEELLEHLFGTTAYKDVSDLLRQDQLELERRAHDLQRARADLLAGRDATSPEALGSKIDALVAQLGDLERQADAAQTAAATARAAHAQAQGLAARFAEHDRVQAELAGLTAARPQHDRARATVAAAERAQPLAPLFERDSLEASALARREDEVTTHERALLAARRALDTSEAAAADLPARKQQLESWVAEDAVLARLAEVEARVDREATVARSARAEAHAATARATAARAALERARAERTKLEAALEAALAAASAEPALAMAATRAAERHEALAAHAAVRQAAHRAATAVAPAREAAARARIAAEHGRALREAGLAAELAAGLTEGEACPVCGAIDHPRLAARADGFVTLEALAALEHTSDDAAAALVQVERRAAETAAAETAAAERVRASGDEDPARPGLDDRFRR